MIWQFRAALRFVTRIFIEDRYPSLAMHDLFLEHYEPSARLAPATVVYLTNAGDCTSAKYRANRFGIGTPA